MSKVIEIILLKQNEPETNCDKSNSYLTSSSGFPFIQQCYEEF